MPKKEAITAIAGRNNILYLCEDNKRKFIEGDRVVLTYEEKASGDWRSIKKIRALYEVAYENGGADLYHSEEAMIKAIKMKAGLWDSFKDVDGNTCFELKSIAYISMTDNERWEFLNDAVTVCCEHICKTLDDQAMFHAIDRFLGFA